MTRVNDLSGREFGRLRVTGRAANDAAGRARWECRCAPDLGGCGATATVRGTDLLGGGRVSCGCAKATADGSAALASHKVAPQGWRVCPLCGTPFEAVGRQVYCSDECRGKESQDGPDECAFCGGPMCRRGYARRYCRPRCKRMAARAKAAERKTGKNHLGV